MRNRIILAILLFTNLYSCEVMAKDSNLVAIITEDGSFFNCYKEGKEGIIGIIDTNNNKKYDKGEEVTCITKELGSWYPLTIYLSSLDEQAKQKLIELNREYIHHKLNQERIEREML